MAVAVALLAGVVLGIVVMLVLKRRPQAALETPAVVVPDEPAADRVAEPGVVVPADEVVASPDAAESSLLEQVIDRIDRAVIVVDAAGKVTFRNSAASAVNGTHVGVLLDSAVDDAVRDCRRGEGVERRVDLHGPPRVSLLLSGEEIANGSVVVVIEDVSERSRIDAMRTDFVANISHELKTPVGAISVLADALVGESDPAVVDRVATRIVEESERAVTTIDDLLELARIETMRPVEEVVDLHDIVHAAVARGRTVDEEKHVRLTAFDARSSIWLRCDPRQLTSAIGNLVENAVKYSDPDGVVQVRTRQDERWVEVMVADQGVGIPPRDLDRIFERFYRVDRARSRVTGGTGLGLSIVRHVVTNHGGDVQVSSTEGEGSTFVVRIPTSRLAEAPGQDAELPAADSSVRQRSTELADGSGGTQ